MPYRAFDTILSVQFSRQRAHPGPTPNMTRVHEGQARTQGSVAPVPGKAERGPARGPDGVVQEPVSQPLSRTERRVLKTKAAIEEAFVAVVLREGYDQATVEDIAQEADVAKATFYAHYESKEALLTAVFSKLLADLAQRISYREGPWNTVRRGAVEALYAHARELQDLYKVCLRDPRARSSYTASVTRYAEENFVRRLAALGREPRVPAPVMARAFAGAHVALLESWLEGEIAGSDQDLAAMQLDLLIAGFAWAHRITLAELGYDCAAPGEA
jgi:AcrR family transcriptional regulator